MQQLLAARIWTEFDMLCHWAQPKNITNSLIFFIPFFSRYCAWCTFITSFSFFFFLIFSPSCHHNITDHAAAFACVYCAVVMFLCVCKNRNIKNYIRQCKWWHCIVCNASSSSLSDAVLLVVCNVTKQNLHQIQFIPSISIRIPIGVSLFLLSFFLECSLYSEWSVCLLDGLADDGC